MIAAAFAAGIAVTSAPGGALSATARSSSAPRPTAVTLEWAGDIALSTQRGLPPGGLERALAPVRGLLRHADITLGNLEGTLSTGGASKCRGIGGGTCFAFQAPPSVAAELRAAGFGLVNQANNHSLDHGLTGRAQTLAALGRAGVAHTGLPVEITVLRVARTRVAFVGFAPYPYDANPLDIPAAKKLVRRARARAPIVVVVIHGGPRAPTGWTRRGGRSTTSARIVAMRGPLRSCGYQCWCLARLGLKPHVIRGIERYRGRLIADSLGNFVGYHTLGDKGVLSESAILQVTLGPRGRVLAGRWIPVHLVEGLPRPQHSGASARLIAKLSGEDFPHHHYDISPHGYFRRLQ